MGLGAQNLGLSGKNQTPNATMTEEISWHQMGMRQLTSSSIVAQP